MRVERSGHLRRPGRALAGAAPALLLALCVATSASCGGGGGGGEVETGSAGTMVLVDFLFVDRSLSPTAPTGSLDLPRNAQIRFSFSQPVEPASVTIQTLRLRTGPQQQDVVPGRFTLSGSVIYFDPTLTQDGQPLPYGLEPAAQYVVDVPAFDPLGARPAVESTDGRPNATPYHTTFVTGDRWLHESVLPRFLGVVFDAPADPATGRVAAGSRVGLNFSEVMDPRLFRLGPPALPLPEGVTVDVRYDAADPENVAGGVAGQGLAGVLAPDPGGQVIWFEPTFTLGNRPYSFTVQLLAGLTDLAGNPLWDLRTHGPYTGDGSGTAPGRLLAETFQSTFDCDTVDTDADWGGLTPGRLVGTPITSREVRLYGYAHAGLGGDSGQGQYAPLVAPLVGRELNNVLPANQIVPPTNVGRRVLLALSEAEMGPRGTVVACAWGPDSNATFASLHHQLVLRMGLQADGTLNLGPSFHDNYAAGTAATVYRGPLSIAQRANVGNVPGEPRLPHIGGYWDGLCWPDVQSRGTWNQPLFDFTGFQPFPALTTYFEWDPGPAGAPNDRVFLFDVSADEGDSWQQMRGWAATTAPCSGFLQPGFASRRLFGVFEGERAEPAGLFVAPNPEPSLYDVAFTLTRRVSVAQSRFYGPDDAVVRAAGGTTYGSDSDYLPMQLTPALPLGGARVSVWYQGAGQVGADRRTIDAAAPSTPWTANVDACDGLPWIRWRLTLESNLISNAVPWVQRVLLPLRRLSG